MLNNQHGIAGIDYSAGIQRLPNLFGAYTGTAMRQQD
jgi:hypothetical protein